MRGVLATIPQDKPRYVQVGVLTALTRWGGHVPLRLLAALVRFRGRGQLRQGALAALVQPLGRGQPHGAAPAATARGGRRAQALARRRIRPSNEARRLTLWLQGRGGLPHRFDLPLLALGLAIVFLVAVLAAMVTYGLRYHNRADALEIRTQQLSAQATAGAQAEGKLAKLQQQAASLQATLQRITRLEGQVRAEAGAPRSATASHATAGLPATDPAVTRLDAASTVLRQLQQAIPGLALDVKHLGESMGTWTADAAHTPSIWPVRGPITSPFGPRRDPLDPAVTQFHTGVDIGVPTGTEVHATAAGTVTFAAWSNIYGNQVIIAMGNGYTTMYGHNSRLLVHAGQHVAKGQVIALSGDTGWSTGPHVHYQIDDNGHPVNPASYLPGYADVAR